MEPASSRPFFFFARRTFRKGAAFLARSESLIPHVVGFRPGSSRLKPSRVGRSPSAAPAAAARNPGRPIMSHLPDIGKIPPKSNRWGKMALEP
jgi:hypothetical protein